MCLYYLLEYSKLILKELYSCLCVFVPTGLLNMECQLKYLSICLAGDIWLWSLIFRRRQQYPEPYSYHQILEHSKKNIGKFRQKNLEWFFGNFISQQILAWGIWSICTSNESKNSMELAVEVSFEIYFGKIREIMFQKYHSEIFWRKRRQEYG